jgi:hypothetical protein
MLSREQGSVLVTYLEKLSHMNLLQLMALFESGDLISADMSAADLRSLVALVASKASEVVDVAFDAIDLPQLGHLYGMVLAAALEVDAMDHRERTLRWINFSVGLIFRNGPTVDSDLLDPAAAARGALREIPMSFEQVRLAATEWRRERVEVVRELRYLKNLLSPLVSLVNEGFEIEGEPEIDRWLEIFPSLP